MDNDDLGTTHRHLTSLSTFPNSERGILFHFGASQEPSTSLRVMNPVLLWWHALWTNLSRIIEKHLVSYSSLDPSSLGHSASKIDRTIRIDQGKYDFHQGSELVYFVIDMCMLDCWRLLFLQELEKQGLPISSTADVFTIVETLSVAGKLPEIEDLEKHALRLHLAYSSEEAIYRSANGRLYQHHSLPPTGEAWDIPNVSPPPVPSAENIPGGGAVNAALDNLLSETGSSSLSSEGEHASAVPKAANVKAVINAPPSETDAVLARSQDFMREAIRSREAAWASAEGDVGRYLLETLFDLELESSPKLRETLLEISHANISGLAGKHKPCDLLQEYFNRILEAIVQHKGREYGERFIREGIARNLHHFQRLKADFLDGVGLAERSSRHTKPHTKPEVRILLHEYLVQRLHYRAGRMIGKEPTIVQTHFKMGCTVMRAGRLKKWITRMMFMWGRRVPESELPDNFDAEREEAEEEDEEEESPSGSANDLSNQSLCAMDMVDGRLVTRTLNPEEDALAIIRAMDAADNVDVDLDEEDNDIEIGQNIALSGFETDDEDSPEQP
ncbi:hypothetical protein BDZ89DRAFT_1216543 [Hymenopellis radicata]|nr:hypothetical protein BDZ89DRAFT_1216543 [Hymenopellis radicata]